MTGAFPEPGPQGGLVVSLYSSPAACPLTTQTREAVVWTAVDTCVRLSATTSAVFSCSATGASAQQWTNPTCSGAPSSTGSQQLGCSTPAGSSGAAFASCTFNPFYSVTIVNQTDDDTFCHTSCSTQPPAVGFGLPNNGVSVSLMVSPCCDALRLSLTPPPPFTINFLSPVYNCDTTICPSFRRSTCEFAAISRARQSACLLGSQCFCQPATPIHDV